MVLGRLDAPILIVMLSAPTEAMMKWMWDKLHHIDIRATDVRVVYMLDEPPAGAHGRATKDQLRACMPSFRAAMLESRPRVVVPLGGPALYATTGIREDINDARGYLISRKLFGRVVQQNHRQIGIYKTSNKARGVAKGDPRFKWVDEDGDPILPEGFDGYVIPSFTLDHIRTEGFAITPAFNFDLDRARRAASGELASVEDRFWFYKSLDGVARQDYTSGLLALDIETPRDLQVVERISFSDGERSHTLPWNEETRAWAERQIALAVERGAVLALHNCAFDLPRLEAAGCPIPKDAVVFDTMLGAVRLQPDLHKGLGRVTQCYLDVEPWKWRRLSDADPERYSAKDSFCTALLAREEIKLLHELGCYDSFMGGGSCPGPGEMPTVRHVLIKATQEGIPLHRQRAIEWCNKLSMELVEHHAAWNAYFPGLNPHSNKDLKGLFYRDWKLPIVKTREDGITVNELALITLRETVRYAQPTDKRCAPEVFDLLLKIRGAAKNLKTYATPVVANSKGRVHPSYLPESKDRETRDGSKRKGNTATGRLAASYPNIQNQPKEARRLYVPDSDLFTLVQADYKSAELCVFAFMAGDTVLQDDLRGDIHTRNAEQLHTDRDTAKNVIYAAQYLAGAIKVSQMILAQQHFYVPPAECERIMKGLARKYNRVTAYKRVIVDQCMNQGFVINPFGRIRFFHSRSAPAAVDFIPQSTVADCLWCVLMPVSDFIRGLGGRLFCTVHDSITVQVPNERVMEAARGMKAIMERRFDNVAPGFFLPVELEVGQPGGSWGELAKCEAA